MATPPGPSVRREVISRSSYHYHEADGRIGRQLRDEFGEELPVVFVSGDRTEPLDQAAGLLLGADDYVVKPFDSDELLARMRRLVTRSGQDGRGSGVASTSHDLTPRELQVLQLLARGLRASQVAEELVISPKTVRNYVSNIISKLQVADRAQAILRAKDAGFGMSGSS